MATVLESETEARDASAVKEMGSAEHPVVSVVVPTAGRRREGILSLLRSLDHSEPSHEVLFVVPPGRQLPNDVQARGLVLEHPGSIAAGLNAGIRVARAPIFAVTHDDCLPEPGWLTQLTEPILHNQAQVCIGQTLPSRKGRCYPTTSSLSFTEPRFVRASRFRPPWELGFAGNNFAFRREAFNRVGPFNEKLGIGSPLRGGEDLDMFHRILAAGITVCVNPRAVVYHEPLDTWQQEVRMIYSYRIGLAAYFWCHRAEPEVGSYFVRNALAGQMRQVWRSFAARRTEGLTIESAALLGLIVGMAKSWLYRP